jgi:hypothetical protein
MIKLEINEEDFTQHLMAITFLNELLVDINKDNTVVLNSTKLHHWLGEIREKLEIERNAKH